MNKISLQYYTTPFGELMIGSFNDQLCLCDWRYRKMRSAIDTRIQKGLQAVYVEEESDIINKTINQLDEYFARERQAFTIPLKMVGSEFQIRVWQDLLRIPYGKTISYLELSKRLGDTLAIRAVASANGANALSILVSCHRIVGSKGELTGYAGGLAAKRKLLELEKSEQEGIQMSLFD